MSYYRVIPRDLFNESKLLKCLGQLALIIHDGPKSLGLKLDQENPEEGFLIDQNPDSGALYCANLQLFAGGRQIGLSIPYNNREAYPLNFEIDDDDGRVFTDAGELSHGFKVTLASLQRAEASQ